LHILPAKIIFQLTVIKGKILGSPGNSSQEIRLFGMIMWLFQKLLQDCSGWIKFSSFG